MNHRIKKNDHPLSELVQQFAQSDKIKPDLYRKKIEHAWLEIMGRWVNQETRSIRLREGKLTLEIQSGALRQELHFARDKIKEKINEFLEEDYITSVVVR